MPGMNPQAVAQFARLFGVRSAVFHVTVVARIGSFSRTYVAMLRKNNPRDIQVLSFYWR